MANKMRTEKEKKHMSKESRKAGGAKTFYGVSRRIWTSVLLAALGLVLIVWPASSVAAIVRLVGIALIVIGTVGLVQQIMAREDKKVSRVVRSLPNLAFLAAGIWVLVNPVMFENLIHFVLGITILIFSLKDLILAVKAKKEKLWLILPVIGIVLGILILVNPFGSFRAFAVFAGIALLYTGAASLVNEVRSR